MSTPIKSVINEEMALKLDIDILINNLQALRNMAYLPIEDREKHFLKVEAAMPTIRRRFMFIKNVVKSQEVLK